MMRRLIEAAFVLAIVVVVSQDAFAQRRGGGMRGLMGNAAAMANQQSVQQELSMTDDQKKQADSAMQSLMSDAGSLRDLEPDAQQKKVAELNKSAEAATAKFLKPEQQKRLLQIVTQRRGVDALASPETAASLKLTDDQKSKIKGISENFQEERRALFGQGGGGGGGGGGQNFAKMQELSKAATEKAVALLTPEQKTKWDEMVGKPFTGEITFGRPRQN